MNREFGTFGGPGPARGIFAPEIHFLKGKFSVKHTTPKHHFGIGLLQADQPQGPWREISPAGPITDGFDALFTDEDGAVYLLKHGGRIARMKPDMTGLGEPLRPLAAGNYPFVGCEGVYLFKHDGRHHLTSAEWNVHADGRQSYDSMVATATNIYGPYGPRSAPSGLVGTTGGFRTPTVAGTPQRGATRTIIPTGSGSPSSICNAPPTAPSA